MSQVAGPDELYDFIGYVVVCAPDQFPEQDFLEPGEQMNLERAFVELNGSLDSLDQEVVTPAKRPRLVELLNRSLEAYRGGDTFGGAHLLQDFQDLIFKRSGEE